MLKKAITKDVNLQYFDPKKPVVLQVHASQVGLGAALLQDTKVITYASKSLTPAETRYANIEHEMLAVVLDVLSFITTYMVDHLYVIVIISLLKTYT